MKMSMHFTLPNTLYQWPLDPVDLTVIGTRFIADLSVVLEVYIPESRIKLVTPVMPDNTGTGLSVHQICLSLSASYNLTNTYDNVPIGITIIWQITARSDNSDVNGTISSSGASYKQEPSPTWVAFQLRTICNNNTNPFANGTTSIIKYYTPGIISYHRSLGLHMHVIHGVT
jgi:hypothetical protein